MAVTVEPNQDTRFPEPWAVMSDRMCYSRHETKEEADKEAEILRQSDRVAERAEELMGEVLDTLVREMAITETVARQHVREYLEVY